MKTKDVLISFILLFFLSYIILNPVHLPAENNNTTAENRDDITKKPSPESRNRFLELKKLYFKWNRGLFKSTRYYRKYVSKYILENTGRDILTDYNYRIISPEGLYGKKLVCNFFIDDWLQIKGEIDRLEIAKIIGKNPDLLTKWWRSEKLLSAGGIIKNFEFETREKGEIVILHLDNIVLFEYKENDTGKNNK